MPKCYLCDNEAQTECYECKKPICEEHSVKTDYAFHFQKKNCPECAEIATWREADKTLWICMGFFCIFMIIFVLIMLLFLFR